MKKILLFCIIAIFYICDSSAQRAITLHDQGKGIESNSSSVFSIPEAIRMREFFLNPQVQTVGFANVGDTLLLNLFQDKNYKAIIKSINIDVNGTYVICSKIISFDYSYCIISTYQDKSFITINLPENDESYKINYNNQCHKYNLIQIDNSKVINIEESEGIEPPVEEVNKTHVPYVSENIYLEDKSKAISEFDTVTITILIVYTPAAAAWSLANETNINNTIGLIIANSNLVLQNSDTYVQLELVHSEQVSYVELNNNNDLYNLQNSSDGIMDNVHDLRNTYCADLVMLLEEISFTGGLGYTMNSTFGISSFAFSLVRVQQASNSSYTPIHEIGHNLGCHHHKEQLVSPGPGLYSYSAGWRWTGLSAAKYCSVMTYTSGTYFTDGITHQRVPYFSNPNVTYQGIPVGDINNGDNAKTFRQSKQVTASYRNGCCTPPSVQATSFSVSSVTDTSATINWVRGNGSSVLVVARQGFGVNSYPIDGSCYLASSEFGNGSQIGFDNNVVVYKGTGNSVNITSLNQGTTYYFAIFEFNDINYCYNLTSFTGNVTTLSTPPPTAGTALADTTICNGETVQISLSGYSGNIQWQQSSDNVTWINVIGGIGETSPNYTTAPLYDTTYYRAQVSQPGYLSVYSNGIKVSVFIIDNSVIQIGSTLTANETSAVYQWVDCDNSFAYIFGETSQSFTTASSGNFAVIIFKSNCSDTSACIQINTTNIPLYLNANSTIYPNPAYSEFTIETFIETEGFFVEIFNAKGQCVSKMDFYNKITISTANFPKGVYFIKLQNSISNIVDYYRIMIL